MSVVFEVVSMDKVPDPPTRYKRGKYDPLWNAISELPNGESHAVRFKCMDQKQFLYVRAQMRKKSDSTGRRLLSSRSADSTVAYFWLEEAKKK